jgi:Tripartite tricarboxylate transporter TctB family
MHRPNVKDLLAGMLFLAFGLGFLLLAQRYPMGSARRMGPGYFPQLLSLLLIAIGLATALRALLTQAVPVGSIALKALLLLSLAVGAFGFTVERGGLAIAVVVLVLISSAASHPFRLPQALVLALALAAFSALLFGFGLGLPFPILRFWG